MLHISLAQALKVASAELETPFADLKWRQNERNTYPNVMSALRIKVLHELVARPWSKVAADLCELDGTMLLVIAHYYSKFIEATCLNSMTSRSVI